MLVRVMAVVTAMGMANPTLPLHLSVSVQLRFLYRMKLEIGDHTGKMMALLGDDSAVRSVLAVCMYDK